MWIIISAIILQAVTVALFGAVIMANILFSIMLGQLYIILIERCSGSLYFIARLENFVVALIHITIIASIWPFTNKIIDYGTIAPAIVLAGYCSKKNDSYYKIFFILSYIFASIFAMSTMALNEPQEYKIAILCCMFACAIFSIFNPKKQINASWPCLISRNCLLLYCAHILLIQIIFFYKMKM